MNSISIENSRTLRISGEHGEFQFDFDTYRGYYPGCRLTACAAGCRQFYAAGTDSSGTAHLFSSADGTVWAEMNLQPRLGPLKVSDYGDILAVFCDDDAGQLFLVGRNGCLITVPDCPRCVRARRISELPLIRAEIDRPGHRILLTDTAGKLLRLRTDTSAEYRCDRTYMEPHLGKDGVLLDLRDPDRIAADPYPGAIPCPEELLEALYEKYPRGYWLFFVCERGFLSDQAVRDAREKGFRNSWSLGGIEDLRG